MSHRTGAAYNLIDLVILGGSVFEKLKARRLERERAEQAELQRQANAAAAAQLAVWQNGLDELTGMLEATANFRGFPPDEALKHGLAVKPDEHLYGVFGGAVLIEPRVVGGHWQGGSQGISVRVPGTKSMRYHVGQMKGHYVSGTEQLRALDTGIAAVTDKRVFFVGPKHNREWLWSKCLAVLHQDDAPLTIINVSNRQKASGIELSPL